MNDSRLTPIEQLHELLNQDALDEETDTDFAADHDMDETDKEIGSHLLGASLAALSPEAQSLLLALTESTEGLEPSTRRKLVAAADRGLRRRRDAFSPLPRLLFLVRCEVQETLEDVARHADVPPSSLRDVEGGRAQITTLPAEKVAAWIAHLHIDAQAAEQSLIRCFQPSSTKRAAAASRADVTDEQDEFVQEVLDRLAELPA